MQMNFGFGNTLIIVSMYRVAEGYQHVDRIAIMNSFDCISSQKVPQGSNDEGYREALTKQILVMFGGILNEELEE